MIKNTPVYHLAFESHIRPLPGMIPLHLQKISSILYMHILVNVWGLRVIIKRESRSQNVTFSSSFIFFLLVWKLFVWSCMFICFKLTVASECCCCICSILQTCRMADLGFKIFWVLRIRRVRQLLLTTLMEIFSIEWTFKIKGEEINTGFSDKLIRKK